MCVIIHRQGSARESVATAIVPFGYLLTIQLSSKQRTLDRAWWKWKECGCGSMHILHFLLLFCLSMRRQNFKQRDQSRHTLSVMITIRHMTLSVIIIRHTSLNIALRCVSQPHLAYSSHRPCQLQSILNYACLIIHFLILAQLILG